MPRANQRSLSLSQMLAREHLHRQQGDTLYQPWTFMMHTHTLWVWDKQLCARPSSQTHTYTQHKLKQNSVVAIVVNMRMCAAPVFVCVKLCRGLPLTCGSLCAHTGGSVLYEGRAYKGPHKVLLPAYSFSLTHTHSFYLSLKGSGPSSCGR